MPAANGISQNTNPVHQLILLVEQKDFNQNFGIVSNISLQPAGQWDETER